MHLNKILLMAAVALVTTVSSRADLESDATTYGNKLAQDLFEHGEKNQEAIYTREVTGANMYGYHSQNDIDSFVDIASHVAAAKGVELKAHKSKADADRALIMKGYMAAQEVEVKARNEMYPTPIYNGDLDAYAEAVKASIRAPMYPLGIIDEVDKFKKAYADGTMTAQQVYDATMKVIADKTTVQAPPPEPIGTPFVETPAMKSQTKAWTENAKKAAAQPTDQATYKANIKSGKWHEFKNGE